MRRGVRCVYDKTARFCFANTFVTSRLTGEYVTDPSMVSMSGLADIRDPRTWSSTLCDMLGFDERRMPGICESFDIAESTGLRAGVPVVNGCVDVVASSLGAGAFSKGSLVLVAGSSDNVTMPLTTPLETTRWVNIAHIPRGAWLGVGTSTSSGSSADWFVREVPGIPQGGHEELLKHASMTDPGSGGVLFLPYLQGERTPLWDPEARGVFVGLSHATSRSRLARAVLEGTSFALRDIVERVFSLYNDTYPAIRKVLHALAAGLQQA